MFNYNTENQKEIYDNVDNFSIYVSFTESIIKDFLNNRNTINEKTIESVLNGQTSAELKKLVPYHIRKNAGIFFTDTSISDRVAFKIKEQLLKGSRILDPACGAGNLLISCIKYLPKGKTIHDTLTIWSDLVYGYDLHPQFIKATKLRLIISAIYLHKQNDGSLEIAQIESLFKGIKVGDGLNKNNYNPNIDCIIVNPPFHHLNHITECKWASGKIQTAAIFIDEILQAALPSQHIIAILPDVLRSGSRYKKWREMIGGSSQFIEIESIGRFEDDTDVDVFILNIIKGESKKNITEWYTQLGNNFLSMKTVSDFFDVHVGSVVPHRDSENGSKRPYVDSSLAKAYEEIISLPYRSFNSTMFNPPFVLIRRTSNPSDKNRIITTIINTNEPVIVENHLIVVIPKDNNLESCRQLINLLKDIKIAEWLNKRIRCRHITVTAIKEIPISDWV